MITAFCVAFHDDKPVFLRSNGGGEGLIFLRLPNRIASEQKTGSICKNPGLARPHFADFDISPLYKSGGIMNTANTDYPKSFFKPIEELTFTDDFMFGAIMKNQHICRGVLERLLRMKIGKIEYPTLQKSISPFYENKGIRLDVYTSDEKHAFDIEI